ncbi:histidinol-phosphate aminotransferase [Neisseria animaloris]|uniref:histidinol-phosphate transaminase n=1 Tax=Neisseria animaloris TaxID=326522 RepID=UPI000A18AC27|nr:histidinol-phosphate transaminase [Neisseria animaloris]OSI07728.1 histidinol-phosphate transaminase [Neisseria animaloris]VEH88360.1 histidinol-phosphate aminotransferase [Neisseria animaloris]
MTTLSDFIRPEIQAMTAYRVADPPEGFIKLDAMESPYHPFAGAPELAGEWQRLLAEAPIHLYPNPATSGLQDALRQAFHIPQEAKIALGNGSDELIQLLTMLVAKPKATMLAVEPSFVMYKHNARLFGMHYVGVPLNEDFTLNMPVLLEAIEWHNPALVFIAYPNNPTGVCFKREEVEAVIDAAKGIVVVDEAYGAFSRDSFLPQAGSIENLVVMRTVSKIGFAGLRIGYASGCAVVIDELAKIVPPYNMNQLSLATAKFALQHAERIEKTTAKLKDERERMFAELSAIGRLKAFPSDANFITVRVPDAQELFDTLKENKILIKNLHGVHPLLDQCVRITVGSPEENDAVLKVIRALYG